MDKLQVLNSVERKSAQSRVEDLNFFLFYYTKLFHALNQRAYFTSYELENEFRKIDEIKSSEMMHKIIDWAISKRFIKVSNLRPLLNFEFTPEGRNFCFIVEKVNQNSDQNNVKNDIREINSQFVDKYHNSSAYYTLESCLITTNENREKYFLSAFTVIYLNCSGRKVLTETELHNNIKINGKIPKNSIFKKIMKWILAKKLIDRCSSYLDNFEFTEMAQICARRVLQGQIDDLSELVQGNVSVGSIERLITEERTINEQEYLIYTCDIYKNIRKGFIITYRQLLESFLINHRFATFEKLKDIIEWAKKQNFIQEERQNAISFFNFTKKAEEQFGKIEMSENSQKKQQSKSPNRRSKHSNNSLQRPKGENMTKSHDAGLSKCSKANTREIQSSQVDSNNENVSNHTTKTDFGPKIGYVQMTNPQNNHKNVPFLRGLYPKNLTSVNQTGNSDNVKFESNKIECRDKHRENSEYEKMFRNFLRVYNCLSDFEWFSFETLEFRCNIENNNYLPSIELKKIFEWGLRNGLIKSSIEEIEIFFKFTPEAERLANPQTFKKISSQPSRSNIRDVKSVQLGVLQLIQASNISNPSSLVGEKVKTSKIHSEEFRNYEKYAQIDAPKAVKPSVNSTSKPESTKNEANNSSNESAEPFFPSDAIKSQSSEESSKQASREFIKSILNDSFFLYGVRRMLETAQTGEIGEIEEVKKQKENLCNLIETSGNLLDDLKSQIEHFNIIKSEAESTILSVKKEKEDLENMILEFKSAKAAQKNEKEELLNEIARLKSNKADLENIISHFISSKNDINLSNSTSKGRKRQTNGDKLTCNVYKKEMKNCLSASKRMKIESKNTNSSTSCEESGRNSTAALSLPVEIELSHSETFEFNNFSASLADESSLLSRLKLSSKERKLFNPIKIHLQRKYFCRREFSYEDLQTEVKKIAGKTAKGGNVDEIIEKLTRTGFLKCVDDSYENDQKTFFVI